MQNKSKDSSCDKIPKIRVYIGESVSGVGEGVGDGVGTAPPRSHVWEGEGAGEGAGCRTIKVKAQCISVMHEFIPKRIHQTHTGSWSLVN